MALSILNGNGDDSFSPLPRGDAQRAGFNPLPPLSVRLAYQGSNVDPFTDLSDGAGLARNAIVKTELAPVDTSAYYGSRPRDMANGNVVYSTDPQSVGAQELALTGMIQKKDIGVTTLSIVADGALDNLLHEIGPLDQLDLGVPYEVYAQASPDDWLPFRVTRGLIGRRQYAVLTGPDGISSELGIGDSTQYVAYEVSNGSSGMPTQSAPTFVMLPDYYLPVPTLGGVGGLTLTLTGTVEARNTDTSSPTYESTQHNNVRLWDDDYLDDLIESLTVAVLHPNAVWDGLLLDYSVSVTLFIDANGYIAGTLGSTGRRPAYLYQQLIEPGWVSNPMSANITVQ